jgi:hypothetical protein
VRVLRMKKAKPKIDDLPELEHPGNELVSWLNNWGNISYRTGDQKRISDLLQKIQRLQYLTCKHRVFEPTRTSVPPSSQGSNGPEEPYVIEACRLAWEMDYALHRYRFVPRLYVSAFRTWVRWLPSPKAAGFEHHMLAVLLGLAERGQLDRIGLCQQCSQWFCSRHPGYQKFCTSKCQQAYYKSSPRWKANRAQYMRRYRKLTGKGGK